MLSVLESGGQLVGVRLAGVTGETLTGLIICVCRAGVAQINVEDPCEPVLHSVQLCFGGQTRGGIFSCI